MKSSKFIDRSDFIKPVVVWESKGSFLESEKTFDIPHGLPFTPLILGEYSWSSDFSNSRDFSDWNNDEENFLVGALAESVRMAMRKPSIAGSGSNRVYYRMVGIAPPDYIGDIKSLSPDKKYDSRKRPLKIISFGKFKHGDIINHNLGYAPMIYCWGITDIFQPGESRLDRMVKCLRPGSYGVLINSRQIKITARQEGYYILMMDPIRYEGL